MTIDLLFITNTECKNEYRNIDRGYIWLCDIERLRAPAVIFRVAPLI